MCVLSFPHAIPTHCTLHPPYHPLCQVVSRLETSDHWVTYAEVLDGQVVNPEKQTAVHRRKVANYY